MSTPHINACSSDFAKVVLMPGDPKRAEWIANNFLHDVKLVNDVRGILGFTGLTKNNIKISVMASGMGHPSIGIYSHELYSHYGVETIIRVGTCGSYQKEINLFDILVCLGASTDSNFASQLALNGTFSAIANYDLVEKSVEVLKAKHLPYHVGNILASDIFYDYQIDNWKKWAKLGILGVEMESYALYLNAAILNKRALTLLTVTDHFINKDQKATALERQEGLAKMIEVAILTAEKFA